MEKYILDLKEGKIKLLVDKVEIGYVLFKLSDNKFIILSTIIFDEFKGRGYAKKLMNYILEYTSKNNYELEYTCSYASNYFKK
ncbi:MAG: GNAT family N-acetyltransferase [Candidatus Onthovivens sp.]|nr:GNAT family N-acetyltransferase [Candidatus Onthovivens sp.]